MSPGTSATVVTIAAVVSVVAAGIAVGCVAVFGYWLGGGGL
jgi:hypothetical protein